MAKIEAMQPRLRNARMLVDTGLVQKNASLDNITVYSVTGTDISHRVELRHHGDHCTCQWFSLYQGKRGPCKHILAANLMDELERIS